jgi:hypothetical protein
MTGIIRPPAGTYADDLTGEPVTVLARAVYPPPVWVMTPCPPDCEDDHGSMGDGC